MLRLNRGLASSMKGAFLLCVVAFPLSACSQSMNNEVPTPEYRENPTPQRAHRVTMTIEGAPGKFGMIVGFVQYDVANTECLPPPKDNPGGRSAPVPTRSLQFAMDRISSSEYTGVVYVDGMIDEDYHGRGVCRWELRNVQVQMKATGRDGETLFMADLDGEDLRAGATKTLYYSKASYPRHPESKLDEPLNSGQADRSRMASWLADGDIFTVTLAAGLVSP